MNTDITCNWFVDNKNKNSMYANRLCRNPVKWKVVLKYGTKYCCTKHKNIYVKTKSFIKSELYEKS